MGEAKRRKELGLTKRINKIQKNEFYSVVSWFPITKKQLSKYPYIAPVTMAIGLILLMVDWAGLNVRA